MMDHKRLKEVLLAFADDPATLHFERNEVIVQIQQEVISARLQTDGGELFVEEDGNILTASQWVATRIAQLDQLAHNLSQLIPPNAAFINSSARLLDQINQTDSDTMVETDNTLETLGKILARRPAGMCTVQYLTSDAGEGKTTLINQLALNQANLYRERKTKWLLVPISLGGNPFLRLDNIIAAGLLNQLRLRRFFYEGFVELIRLGFIVLALDGFEEVFVETAGDAVSSVGNLIRDLEGEGTVLIAARTAYFDFRRLDQQARLYDSLPNFEVGFSKLTLCRWSETEFLEMCDMHGLEDGNAVYQKLIQILPANHPLLTRAVFVRRLIDLAKDNSLDFLDNASNLNDFFHPFIDNILDREIRFKWIDNSTGVAAPLLTLGEHHELLELLAEEMLLSKRTALPISACQDYSDIFCEARRKPPMVARQVRDRITNHALLIVDATKTQVSFDHDHFREFFVGELVGGYMLSGSDSDARKVLRVEPLAGFSLDTAISTCMTRNAQAATLIERIHNVALSEGAASFVRENCGGLTTRVLNRFEDHSGSVINDLSFPSDSLIRRLHGVTFRNCYFQETALSSEFKNVAFEDCDFEWIEIEETQNFAGVKMTGSKVRALTLIKLNESSREFFEPRMISSLLARHGVDLGPNETSATKRDVFQEDEELVFVRKLINIFTRSTVMSDHFLGIKFGSAYPQFDSEILPRLIDAGFVVEIPNRGGGSQRRYRLGCNVSRLSEMLAAADGSFESFLTMESRFND